MQMLFNFWSVMNHKESCVSLLWCFDPLREPEPWPIRFTLRLKSSSWVAMCNPLVIRILMSYNFNGTWNIFWQLYFTAFSFRILMETATGIQLFIIKSTHQSKVAISKFDHRPGTATFLWGQSFMVVWKMSVGVRTVFTFKSTRCVQDF